MGDYFWSRSVGTSDNVSQLEHVTKYVCGVMGGGISSHSGERTCVESRTAWICVCMEREAVLIVPFVSERHSVSACECQCVREM